MIDKATIVTGLKMLSVSVSNIWRKVRAILPTKKSNEVITPSVTVTVNGNINITVIVKDNVRNTK